MTAAPTIYLPPGVGRDIVLAKPRRARLESPPALTASSARVTKQNGQDFRRLIQPWQARAMSYYDMIGEVWYCSQFYSRALAKTRLFPALLDDNGDPEETDDKLLTDLWSRVQEPGGGRGQLQASYGRLMFITGEGYLTVTPDPDWGEAWEFLSSDELRVQPGGIFVRYTAPQLDAETYVDAPDDAFEPIPNQQGPDAIVPYRLWRKHPRYSAWADSPMRAVLDLCEEILLLTLAVRSRAKSRAANGGLLLWPDESSFPQIDTSGDEDPTNDPFFDELAESMMAPISDPGTASAAVPMLVRLGKDIIRPEDGGPRLMQLVDPKDNYGETGLRTEAIRRFALGVDLPPEQLLGMTDANHWCVDEQTEILTRDRGWITQDELGVGDIVRTLNHETGLAEWQPVEDIYRADVIDEPMRRLETRTHSSLSTLNHKWPVLRQRWRDGQPYQSREWATTRELVGAHTIITGAMSGDQPVSAVHAEELVELAAWFWTEGNISGTVTIAQSHTRNPERVARIRQCLSRLYGPPRDSLRNLDTPAWSERIQPNESSFGGPITVFVLNRHASAPLKRIAPNKRVEPGFICSLTAPQLDLFIDISCQADGHHYLSGERDLWQKNPDALDGYELAVVLAGNASSRQPSHDEGTVVRALRGVGVRPIKAAYEATRRAFEGAVDEIVGYTGVVWCPTTRNHTWLARRNGRTFYSGNSGWLIDEQSWKAHLMPVTQAMCDDFNSAYLRPAAREAGFANWKNVAIGYDATEVINHPDKGKDYLDLYNARAIGKSALRIAKGATDDDAPSEDELNEMIGVAIRDGSFAKYGIPSVRSAIEPEAGDIEAPTGSSDVPVTDASGADNEPGPPAGGEPEPRAPVTASADRILGAAEMAVERCRELAGTRLVRRARNAKCGPCLEKIKSLPSVLIASALGATTCNELYAENPTAGEPRELVTGGTQAFVASAVRLGISTESAGDLADIIELHAARTLHDEQPAALPAGFYALLQRIAA